LGGTLIAKRAQGRARKRQGKKLTYILPKCPDTAFRRSMCPKWAVGLIVTTEKERMKGGGGIFCET
jgi:hypothetical protein